MAKGYYPRGAAAASLDLTDGDIYQGLTSPAKLYSHPLKNLCDYRKSQEVLFCIARADSRDADRYLLVKKVIVHLYLWVGFEVIWHQHDRDLNMAQFIDLEKHEINSTGYYHPDEDNWTLHHTGKETWWTRAFCPPLPPTMNSVLQSSLLPAPIPGLGGTGGHGGQTWRLFVPQGHILLPCPPRPFQTLNSELPWPHF